MLKHKAWSTCQAVGKISWLDNIACTKMLRKEHWEATWILMTDQQIPPLFLMQLILGIPTAYPVYECNVVNTTPITLTPDKGSKNRLHSESVYHLRRL
jgi:hypothetical protein